MSIIEYLHFDSDVTKMDLVLYRSAIVDTPEWLIDRTHEDLERDPIFRHVVASIIVLARQEPPEYFVNEDEFYVRQVAQTAKIINLFKHNMFYVGDDGEIHAKGESGAIRED